MTSFNFDGKSPSDFTTFEHTAVCDTDGKLFTPYVYAISWTEKDIHYIGVSYKKGSHPSKFWANKGYFTSSKKVKAFVKEFGDPDVIKIISTFESADSARDFEHSILEEYNAGVDNRFLNMTTGGRNFAANLNKGKVVVRDNITGECIQVSTDYDRTKFTQISKDMIVATEVLTGKTVSVPREEFNKNRKLYTRHTEGKIAATNIKTNEIVYVNVNELSDDIVPLRKNKVFVIRLSDGVKLSVSKDEFYSNKDKYKTPTNDTIRIKMECGKSKSIPKDEFDPLKHVRDDDFYMKKGFTVYFDIAVGEFRRLESAVATQSPERFIHFRKVCKIKS